MTIFGKQPFRSAWRGVLILVCLLMTACSDSGRELSPSQTLTLDAGCDVRQGCIGRSDTWSVSVRMAPHRSALKPFRIEVSSDAGVEDVTVSLEMQGMDMGRNRYRLLRTEKGNWQAEVTLPICTSGRSDWIAVFEVQILGKPYQLNVPFTLE